MRPIALGALHVTQDAILGNIGIPRDALTPILQMLIAGRFNFVLMRGSRFRHRGAKVSSLRLETALTEDDVALGEESVACPLPRRLSPTLACQASPGPEKIEVAGVVRGRGSWRSGGEDRDAWPPFASYRFARSRRRRRVNGSALSAMVRTRCARPR